MDQWDQLRETSKKPNVVIERQGNHYVISYDGARAGTFGTKAAAEDHVKAFEKAWETNDKDRLQDAAWDIEADSAPDIQGESGKYAEYQLPGGKNYGELLLHLPEKTELNPKAAEIYKWAKKNPEDAREYGTEDYAKRFGITPSQANRIRNIINRDGSIVGQNYHSSHWDEPNVLAHVRFNDRTIDGKKTLFLEEVQSDWHQAGRKQGYKITPPDASKWRIERTSGGNYRVLDEHGVMQNEFNSTDKRTPEQMIQRTIETKSQGVPDAPFKKTWPDLVLKRMIRYAAENGYDKIAWTPGEVQAARWRGTGEEGHGKFYDEILVNAANKLGKAHGAKVSEGEIPIGKDLHEGVLDFQRKHLKINSDAKQTVHTLDITPQLKDTALRKGMPLFQAGVPIQPVTFDPFNTKDKNKDQERAPVAQLPKFKLDKDTRLMMSPFHPHLDWLR